MSSFQTQTNQNQNQNDTSHSSINKQSSNININNTIQSNQNQTNQQNHSKDNKTLTQLSNIINDLLQFSYDINIKSQKQRLIQIIESIKSILTRLSSVSLPDEKTYFNLHSASNNSPDHRNTHRISMIHHENAPLKNSFQLKRETMLTRSKPNMSMTMTSGMTSTQIEGNTVGTYKKLNKKEENEEKERKNQEILSMSKQIEDLNLKINELTKENEGIRLENEENISKMNKLKSEYNSIIESKHNLQSLLESLKINKYKSDLNKVKLNKKNENMDFLVKLAREEMINSIRKEKELEKEVETKGKMNKILLKKLDNKSKRLEQVREVNKKMENVLLKLIEKKDYFDEVTKKVVEVNEVIKTIKKEFVHLENENVDLKRRISSWKSWKKDDFQRSETCYMRKSYVPISNTSQFGLRIGSDVNDTVKSSSVINNDLSRYNHSRVLSGSVFLGRRDVSA